MSKPKRPKSFEHEHEDAPETLRGHYFYGLKLDPEQETFRDAIYSDDNDIIFCNAVAGCGKTLIAVATANLMVKYGKYDGIVYIVSPVQEERVGFLPGNVDEKMGPYGAPLYDALTKLDIDPMHVINQNSIWDQKEGLSYIDCIGHVYLRGCNFENKIIIVEEAQNYYKDELKKTLTRVCENSKTIVIGHTGQCDLYHCPEDSGFDAYIEHFKDKERCAVCELTTNHRGWVSAWADELE